MYETQSQIMRAVLLHLVGLKRPYNSREEGSVIPYLVRTIPAKYPQWVDGAGNLHVNARESLRDRTLFVAHTDTVHRVGGVNAVHITPDAIHAVDAPLGADDAAGVSILAAMIGTVPGYYIFTRGEECGGIGARYLADECADILEEFDRAIAFDRRGTSDIITHQSCGRCCSDEFADALADCLNDAGMLYMPSDAGIYTDTAEFVGHIPECTNISTGYYLEHTPKEWLDTNHHAALLVAALGIDWDSLPVSRPTFGGDCETVSDEYPPLLKKSDDAIFDAFIAALDGRPKCLMELVAGDIHPGDPAWAIRRLDSFSFCPDAVEKEVLGIFEWDDLLRNLADSAYIEI